MQQGDSLWLLSRPWPLGEPQAGCSPGPRGQGPLLPGPSLTETPQLDPVLQTNPAALSLLHPRICTRVSLLQQGPGPSPTMRVDRWTHGWTE